MRSSTSSEGPRLVRIAVPCAQTRVAIEMHSRTNGAKCRAFREACSAGHRMPSLERNKRRGLFFRHSLVVDSTPALRGVVYEIILIGSKFVLLQLACALY